MKKLSLPTHPLTRPQKLKNKPPKTNSVITFICLLVFSSLLSLFIYFNLSQSHLVPWDEGQYILDSFQVSQAIRKLDLVNFYWLSRNQFYNPFFQSWFLGFATLPFGFTVNTARLVSSFLLVPAIFLIWSIGKKLDPNSVKSSFLAVILTATSPLVLFYFSNTMREGLGATLALLTLWLYLTARQSGRNYLFVFTGLSLLLLSFTKYHYGLLLLVPLGLETAIWFFSPSGFRRKSFWLSQTFLFLPFIFGMFYWLYPSWRFNWYREILTSTYLHHWYSLYDTTLLGHLLYFPQELAMSYSFSVVEFFLIVIGFLFALKNYKNLAVRLLATLFLVHFFLAERYIENNQARYIFVSVPALFLVSSFGLKELFPRFIRLLHQPLFLGIVSPFLAVIAFFLLKDLVLLPSFIKPTASHQWESAAFYEQDYQNVSRFNFDKSTWPHTPPPPDYERQEDIFRFVLSHVNVHSQVTLLGFANELSPGLFNFYIEKARSVTPYSPPVYSEYLVDFEISPGSRFDSPEYHKGNIYVHQQARLILQSHELKSIAQKDFPYLGFKITILGRI